MAVDEALVVEALRRGLIDEDQARQHLGMTHVAGPEQDKRSVGEQVLGGTAAAGTGLVNAAAGAVGFPGEVQGILNKAMGVQLPAGTTGFPTREKVKEAVGDATGMSLYKPRGTFEDYIARGAEGAGSMINPFGKTTAVAPAFGSLMGLGGKAAYEAMPGSAVGQVVGQGTPLAALMYFMGKKPQSAKGMAEWLDAVGPDALRAGGEKAAKAGATLGTDVSLAQGMDRPGPVADLMGLAMQHPKGMKLYDMFGKQQQAGLGKVDELVDAISQRGGNGSSAYLTGGRKGNLEITDPIKQEMKAAVDIGKGASAPLESIPAQLRGPKGTDQEKRFNAMITAAAKANGQDPTAARLAANDLLDAMETSSRLQQPIRAGADIKEQAGRTLPGSILDSFGIWAPFRQTGARLDKYNYDKVMEKVIDAFTTADGAEKLIKIAGYSGLAHKSEAVARALLSVGIQNQPR